MRLLFAGTPEPAVPALRALLASQHEVVAVLTRPDARAGRGRQLVSSPVAAVAAEAGVEVLRPMSPRDEAFLGRLHDLAPDCCPVVAYGALIPSAALAVPRHGWVNLHFSVLPAWRGAAPVQHAVLAGDEVSGATTFQLEEGLDTGPVYGVMTETVRPGDTAGDLLNRLAEAGAQLLMSTLDGIADGSVSPRPQPLDGVSYAPKLEVADAQVDWTAPAARVDRLVRACTPAPGAWTAAPGGTRLKLGPVVPVDEAPLPPGQVRTIDAGIRAGGRPGPAASPGDVLVGTGTRPVRLTEVQPAGKRAMPAADWIRGVRWQAEARLGDDR
ncbi:MAG: methionyl-tRNA formyltransferase [Angustibacter sp.]